MEKRSKREFTINVLSLIIIGSALLLTFAPDFSLISNLAYYTLHFMFAFLLLGMTFLFFSQRRLMFASLISCGLLCVFLKKASNQHIVLPDSNNLPSLDIAHFNLSNIQENRDSLFKMLKRLDPDVISFQEFTPDWNNYFESNKLYKYDYFSKEVRIDPYGMCILSKYPIKNANLYYHKDIPNYKSNLVMDDLSIAMYTSYLLPPFSPSGKVDTRAHLQQIVHEVNDSDLPSIVLGDFNMVYWEKDISDFRSNAKLSNSRRDIDVKSLKIPYDHIFYSEELECTSFVELFDGGDNHIGIYGQFQVKSEDILENSISPKNLF